MGNDGMVRKEENDMTIREAIEYFEYNKKHRYMSEIRGEAENIAMVSLKAWEKVLEELGNTNMDILTDEVKAIIKKHLQEVQDV